MRSGYDRQPDEYVPAVNMPSGEPDDINRNEVGVEFSQMGNARRSVIHSVKCED